MATTNQDRVKRAFELLQAGLEPFVRRETPGLFAHATVDQLLEHLRAHWPKFEPVLGGAGLGLYHELNEAWSEFARQKPFSGDAALRVLDNCARMLTAISAGAEAGEVESLRTELLRVRFDDQMRSERRRAAGAGLEIHVNGGIKPWRDVLAPHPDVRSGGFQQAEFAADLWQVHLRLGPPEYREPAEFFRRTFLTESLKQLLTGAMRRLGGLPGGDPVVQLQTNFGGGKTHSMLALYHLFSGAKPGDLIGVEPLMHEAGIEKLPVAKPVVLVGNKISPGNPVVKADGTEVRTLWGELAWQLGGRAAFDRIRADDERATNPGDALRELFTQYGPCLILMDEWVAYARQLHDAGDGRVELPGGSFETHFSFAQALTESAKLAPQCLLVIALPASRVSGSPHTRADDIEVGGERGREALSRLQNVIGRVEASWRPATAEEGFEIVRRRLFEPLVSTEQYAQRDLVARTFYDFYRKEGAVLPPECSDSEYERRLKSAYPIHPEVFERLYNDWSTLEKFQRTRGVLRLMAAVIHTLWNGDDKAPLILPASLPLSEPAVRSELYRNLPDNWSAVVEADVDGPNSLPRRLDAEFPSLGRYSACRRAARTIFLGSAPSSAAPSHGIEDRRIVLGCAAPGESVAAYSDALRRLATAANYLYHDGARYWYATRPTVTKLAESRAEDFARHPDATHLELEARLRNEARSRGAFTRVHPLPKSVAEVPDHPEAKLAILGLDQLYSRDGSGLAESAAATLLGPPGRIFRNSLVFLAADQTRMQDLVGSACRFLAWRSLLDDRDKLELTKAQVTQAESALRTADAEVSQRLLETYCWLLVPEQTPGAPAVSWSKSQLRGAGTLADRASKKLIADGKLASKLAPTALRVDLDNVPLWTDGHVAIRKLADDYASFLNLQRLTGPDVLTEAIQSGLALTSWDPDSFAYADSFDAANGRYRGLRAPANLLITPDDPGLLVHPAAAKIQMEAEAAATPGRAAAAAAPAGAPASSPSAPPTVTPPAPAKLARYHGSVELDSARVGRDAARIADEVIAHLSGLVGASVRVTLEIEASMPGGAPEPIVRVVTENGRTLHFASGSGFEPE